MIHPTRFHVSAFHDNTPTSSSSCTLRTLFKPGDEVLVTWKYKGEPREKEGIVGSVEADGRYRVQFEREPGRVKSHAIQCFF